MQSLLNSNITFSRKGNNGSHEYHSLGQGKPGPEALFPDNQSTDQALSPNNTVVTPALPAF